MSSLRDQIDNYVRRVKDLAEHVRGNEQATKQSLIGPFFTMLGYDLTDPRECVPEFKADFGKERSSKPIDWAFLHNGTFAFFVEAKEVGKKLAGYDEQLADYFAKDPNVKLGILTNGVQWRFFTDVVNSNVMDREPFARWDIIADEPPPVDVITLLQKSQFNPELIRAYAQRQRAQNLLVTELARLLEPAHEFTKLAIANLESRNLTEKVTEGWKPIVANALNEWARQRMLTAALASPQSAQNEGKQEAAKIETPQQELDAFATVKRLLGDERSIAYEDSVAYFKIHLVERRTWVMTRLQMDRKNPLVWVPLSQEQVASLAPGRATQTRGDWVIVVLDDPNQIEELGPLLQEAYAYVKRQRVSGESNAE
jgi:predicted type IV restriction endonuclease